MAEQCRAMTVQQPFAAAMLAGHKNVENRHYSVTLPPDGSGLWVGIHVGRNSKWLNDRNVMAKVRKLWPGMPDDVTKLKRDQGKIVGVALLSKALPIGEAEAQGWGDAGWVGLPCRNEFVWRVSRVAPLAAPFAHSGQLRVWRVNDAGSVVVREAIAAAKSRMSGPAPHRHESESGDAAAVVAGSGAGAGAGVGVGAAKATLLPIHRGGAGKARDNKKVSDATKAAAGREPAAGRGGTGSPVKRRRASAAGDGKRLKGDV